MRCLKNRCLEVETLETRELLAVYAGGIAGYPDFDHALSPSLVSSERTFFTYGVGDIPEAGSSGADLKVLFQTSQSIEKDFSALTLYVGIDKTALSLLSVSEFDSDRAGVCLADSELDSVPDITVKTLFTENLVKNGSFAVYLYAGGEESPPVSGDWYLKVTWFNFKGDWTSGTETVTTGLELLSIHLNLDTTLVEPAELILYFNGDGGDWWNTDQSFWSVPVQPEPSSDLVASVSCESVSVQTGCSFFLSGKDSYSLSGKEITDWFWNQSGGISVDAEGENVWLEANRTDFNSDGIGSVFLTVGDGGQKKSAPAEVNVTRIDVMPSISGNVESLGENGVVLAEISYADAAGAAGAFWEIDWGDGETDTYDSLSFSLSAAHCYTDRDGVYIISARVTDSDGKRIGYGRIGQYKKKD